MSAIPLKAPKRMNLKVYEKRSDITLKALELTAIVCVGLVAGCAALQQEAAMLPEEPYDALASVLLSKVENERGAICAKITDGDVVWMVDLREMLSPEAGFFEVVELLLTEELSTARQCEVRGVPDEDRQGMAALAIEAGRLNLAMDDVAGHLRRAKPQVTKVFVYEAEARLAREPQKGAKARATEDVEMTLRLTLLDGATGNILDKFTLAATRSIEVPQPTQAEPAPRSRAARPTPAPGQVRRVPDVSMTRDASARSGSGPGVAYRKLLKAVAVVDLETLLTAGWYRTYQRLSDKIGLDTLYEYEPGMVIVTSSPAHAHVFLGTKQAGVTPLAVNAEEGDEITVHKPGYRLARFRVPVGHCSVHAYLRPINP